MEDQNEPHYYCAATTELHPESDLHEVDAYKVKTSGIVHFDKEYIGSAYIAEYKVDSNYIDIDVLFAFGEPIMVYKGTSTYGHSHRVSEMDNEEQEMWQKVVDSARENK